MLKRAASRFLRSILRPIAELALAAAPAAAAATPQAPLVLAFGDSLTAGYQLPLADGFTAQLERALRGKGIAATVHNAGVSGDTSTGGRARLAWVLGGLHAQPDLVILELGANDMLRGVDPAAVRVNLDAMLADLRARHIPVLLAGMRAAPNLGAPYVRRFDAIYPELASKYRVPLYPFFLDGVTLHPDLQLPDRLHPTARGVAVMVRGILPAVVRALPHG